MRSRHAERGDVQRLQTFRCTTPPRRDPVTKQVHHARRWEYEVQSFIRATRLPARPPRFVLIGEDDHGELAWVAAYREEDGPGAVFIEYLAVSVDHRGGDRAAARHMLDALLGDIEGRAADADVDELVVTANVWSENQGSNRLCSEAGFLQTGCGDEPGYLEWTTVREIGTDTMLE